MNVNEFFMVKDMNIECLTSISNLRYKIGCFSASYYHDELFNQLDIIFPNSLESAVSKRRAEYLAGRILAREILHDFKIYHFSVLSTRRCPIWPKNIVGSISHKSSVAICVGAKNNTYSGVGVDIENIINEASLASIKNRVLDVNEQDLFDNSAMHASVAVTIGFSVKESLFKALYPSVQKILDFSIAKIIKIDIDDGEIELELTLSLSLSFYKGRKFKAHFTKINDSIITIVTLPAV